MGNKLQACLGSMQLNAAGLTASALAKIFLPRLLPAAWHNQTSIQWTPPEPSSNSPERTIPTRGTPQPSREWMRGLWGMLVDVRGYGEASSWPIVPVQGGMLCQPGLSSAVGPACDVCRTWTWLEPVIKTGHASFRNVRDSACACLAIAG